ncbi:hypothetical protein GCM10010400_15920 [Streptomyces aculeolatus]
MVPKTSEDLPDPETPVKTESRRLGMSSEMPARLFARAPRTLITSWVSAGLDAPAAGPGGWFSAACAEHMSEILIKFD